jgi:hypothetical protein
MLREISDKIKILFRSNHPKIVSATTSKQYIAAKCGHKTTREGEYTVFGFKNTVAMPLNNEGGVNYCVDYISKMAIQCAWCKRPILIGDIVTLYSPPEDFEIPKHAVVYSQNPLALVGCQRTDCADTAADYAGLWLPGDENKGCVIRRPTAYEHVLGKNEDSIVIKR